MEFKGFSKKTLPFLESIRKNNNKEWFESHRDEYEKYILQPSRAFVEEFGEHLMALEPTINFSPKINKSLFRIYRDTRRMGAIKVPLKHRIGVIFWQGSGSRMQTSSFYLHFSPDELFVAVGVAIGIALGSFRIIDGGHIHYYIIVGYMAVVALTFVAPKHIIPIAYDSGGVTTSTVTVPLVAALGLGLAEKYRGTKSTN